MLHPAVFSGWQNAAAIAHEWGFEPYLVPRYSFLSMIFIYQYDNVILWYLYMDSSKPLYSMHKFWAWAALYPELPPLKSLVLHDTHLQFCVIIESSNLSWHSSQMGGIKMCLSQAQTMLWRDFSCSETKFSLRFKIWTAFYWNWSSIFTSKVPLPQPTSSRELV